MIKKIIKNEKMYFLAICLLEVIITFVLCTSIYKISTTMQQKSVILYRDICSVVIFSLIVLAIIVLAIDKYRKSLEKIFMVCLLPLGMLFLMLLPINMVPDEEGHIYKTYEISRGIFITPLGEKNEGDMYVPKQILDIMEKSNEIKYNQIYDCIKIKANYSELVPSQSITKTYSAINYLPGAITFFICRTLNINMMLAIYLVRLVNLIIYSIIIYYSIKMIPFGKLLLAIYLLTPMAIQQAASCSADVFINSISILFITYNLKLLYQKSDLNIRQGVVYSGLIIGISISKYIYFPLVFMCLILLKNKHIDKKKILKLLVYSSIISLFISIGWFLFSQKYVDVRQVIIDRNVKPIEQIKFIIKNPFKYIKIFALTLENKAIWYIETCIGRNLGLLTIKVPEIYIVLLYTALIFLPFAEKNEKSLSSVNKYIFNGIAIVLIGLILTGLYITWSSVGLDFIDGVQGRYFIPVFILILLAMINSKNNIEIKNLENKYVVLVFFVNIVSIINVVKIFII